MRSARSASVEQDRMFGELALVGHPKKEDEEDMAKRIYVGNLPFSCTEDELRTVFEEHGSVHSVALISDRETGRPRGFGFVEMDDEGADAAIEALDQTDFGGRNLKVNEAKPRERRPPSRDHW